MFLDTSGLLCILDPAEPFHQLACDHYDAALKRITHSYVIAELVPLASVRGVNRRSALESIDDLLSDPDVETVWIGEDLVQDALLLLWSRLDKTYSLCDAISFLLMRDHGLQEALTTDHHFEQEGFIRLLK